MTISFNQIGSDIEVVAEDVHKTAKSVLTIIEGRKDSPQLLTNGGTIQADGVLCEFNVPSSKHFVEFFVNISNTVKEVDDLLKINNLFTSFVPVQHYSNKELKHPEAKLIGCQPDYNAWTEKKNVSIKYNSLAAAAFSKGLRSLGGHIHFSFNEDLSFKEIRQYVFKIVRQLDLYLGIPALIYDIPSNRRLLYGQAGSCRITTYPDNSKGGEYRTLSNFWANPKYSWIYSDWIFKTVKHVVNNISSLKEPPFEVQNIINNGDIKKAIQYMKTYNLGVSHVA